MRYAASEPFAGPPRISLETVLPSGVARSTGRIGPRASLRRVAHTKRLFGPTFWAEGVIAIAITARNSAAIQAFVRIFISPPQVLNERPAPPGCYANRMKITPSRPQR